jgi:hypothetical protein
MYDRSSSISRSLTPKSRRNSSNTPKVRTVTHMRCAPYASASSRFATPAVRSTRRRSATPGRRCRSERRSKATASTDTNDVASTLGLLLIDAVAPRSLAGLAPGCDDRRRGRCAHRPRSAWGGVKSARSEQGRSRAVYPFEGLPLLLPARQSIKDGMPCERQVAASCPCGRASATCAKPRVAHDAGSSAAEFTRP